MTASDTDKVVYNFIVDYKHKHGGNSPSYRTIQSGTGIGRQTAHTSVMRMERNGIVEFRDGDLCLVGETYLSPEETDIGTKLLDRIEGTISRLEKQAIAALFHED